MISVGFKRIKNNMSETSNIKLGIIAGTGLTDIDILTDKSVVRPMTPWGLPADDLVQGKLSGVDCVLMNRHGRAYDLMPSNIPYRANVWALKEAQCTHIISVTACGSLQEDYKPGDFVLPDQFIDRTTRRIGTFYDGAPTSPAGIAFLPMTSPFCSKSRQVIQRVAEEEGISCHNTGTLITVEGPRFSTMAESHLYRSWNGHIINMTTVPEVILAKEAGMSYACIAMVTDYDCWKESEDSVSVEMVMKQMEINSENLVKLVTAAVPEFLNEDWHSVIQANRKLASNNVVVKKKTSSDDN